MILFEEETAPYRKTPLPPAYMVVGVRLSIAAYRVLGVRGSMISDKTAPSARPVAVHVAPLFVETKTPPPAVTYELSQVPAYRVVGTLGLMAREDIFTVFVPLLGKPVFITVQWPPLSVERKTPPKPVPAYRMAGVFGSTARERTS